MPQNKCKKAKTNIKWIHTPLLVNKLNIPVLFFMTFPVIVPLTVYPPSLIFAVWIWMFGVLPESLPPFERSSKGMSSGGGKPVLYFSITNKES